MRDTRTPWSAQPRPTLETHALEKRFPAEVDVEGYRFGRIAGLGTTIGLPIELIELLTATSEAILDSRTTSQIVQFTGSSNVRGRHLDGSIFLTDWELPERDTLEFDWRIQ